MKAVIWGAYGQDGFYMTQWLRQLKLDVVQIGRQDVDLTNLSDVSAIIRLHRPEYIFNFAANSTTRHEVWRENHDSIGTGSLNLLESVRLYSPASKLFLSGSGLQFRNTGLPISETAEFDATSMYAASRIYSSYAARYFRSLGVQCYVGYFFNHDSPLRSARHVNQKIIETARRIAAGSLERLPIGNTGVKKEFGYARDIVKGVWHLMQQDQVFEAAIGTGIAHSIGDWLEICFGHFGLNWQQYVDQDPQFKSEYEVLVSDPSLINQLGWRHETDIYELAKIMIEG